MPRGHSRRNRAGWRITEWLRQHPHSTAEEMAVGVGLSPSTVRGHLARLRAAGTAQREPSWYGRFSYTWRYTISDRES